MSKIFLEISLVVLFFFSVDCTPKMTRNLIDNTSPKIQVPVVPIKIPTPVVTPKVDTTTLDYLIQ